MSKCFVTYEVLESSPVLFPWIKRFVRLTDRRWAHLSTIESFLINRDFHSVVIISFYLKPKPCSCDMDSRVFLCLPPIGWFFYVPWFAQYGVWMYRDWLDKGYTWIALSELRALKKLVFVAGFILHCKSSVPKLLYRFQHNFILMQIDSVFIAVIWW